MLKGDWESAHSAVQFKPEGLTSRRKKDTATKSVFCKIEEDKLYPKYQVYFQCWTLWILEDRRIQSIDETRRAGVRKHFLEQKVVKGTK